MSKILFLTLHRKDRSPGQRFRHEQYLDFLEENGFEITYSNMLSESQDKPFYGQGNFFSKIKIGLSSVLKRWRDVRRAKEFDFIFIYRDAFFFGTFFEKMLKKSRAKLIFDFDDSIWLNDENSSQSIFQKLKNSSKTNKIIALCDLVVAGNEYLANHATQFNENVVIIPTTIDLEEYKAIEVKKETGKVCIGWSGSFSTVKHFESAVMALSRIKSQFSNVYIKVIGDGNYINDDLDVKGLPWVKKTEIEDLCEIDIGIMPLPDDDWSKGKCGLKGLQYMALGIPTIMFPVGVNTDIIVDGVNGMLASSEDEWVRKLTLLIQSKELRKTMGQAGRETVLSNYSVEANKKKWLDVFQN